MFIFTHISNLEVRIVTHISVKNFGHVLKILLCVLSPIFQTSYYQPYRGAHFQFESIHVCHERLHHAFCHPYFKFRIVIQILETRIFNLNFQFSIYVCHQRLHQSNDLLQARFHCLHLHQAYYQWPPLNLCQSI